MYVTSDASGEALLGSKLQSPKSRWKEKYRLYAYDPAVPKTVIRTPATAGPPVRATLKTIALRPIALITDPGGTASEIIEAREGCWNVWTVARPIKVA
jgi:hypothetical protein